ncbi:MAG: hypothetical protein HYR51_18200 [Candidatus Rokubacteria bacterium]|nr:hypothetical protein [Candidatus Rokubacteria bacterium]
MLDYVPDDVRAMREIRRVLRPAGVAIIKEGVDRSCPIGASRRR